MIAQDLGLVTAYAYAVSQGYTGTEEEFAELMASYATVAERAEAAATAAETAQGKAEDAQTAAEGAQTAAETAQGKAEDAQGYAEAAETAAETAQGKAEDAQTAAEGAQTAAETAQGKAEAAQTAAEGAQTAAESAQGYAEGYATAASGSASASSTQALKSEGYAVGTQDGTPVASGSPYYEYNSKYFADEAAAVAASIPEDYSELSEDVDDLKSAINVLEDVAIEHPTTEYLKADVRSGSLQGNGSYAAESDSFGVGYKIPLAPDGKITITPYGPDGFKYKIRFVTFAEGETSGTLTQTGVLNADSYTFTQPAGKEYLMFCIYYYHADDTLWSNILDEFTDTDVLVKTEIITEVLPLAHMEDVAAVQGQTAEQEELLAYDRTYLNIMQGASTFEDNKFINDRGITVSNPNFCLIDGFYPVNPNTTYKLYRGEPSLYSNAGHNWTWWDSNKTFISYVLSGSAVTSPSNAAFLRFAVYISSTGSVTHADFDPSKVIITEDALPCFDDIFIKTPARPTFNGLKWIGIGDSITEANFRATYHYWDYIMAETGLNFVNMGVSGTGYKAEGNGDKAFYKRVPSMATDADVITIFGGVNDVVLSNADIGTETDTGTTTICGCVNTTLDAIETLYPANMPIGIISPLPCYCSDTTVNIHPYQQPNDDTCRMAQFVEQLALICKHRGIPFLDLFHQSNLRPWHQECNAKYFSCESAKTGDGLHPNGHGHRLFYRQIMDFVQRIVMQ